MAREEHRHNSFSAYARSWRRTAGFVDPRPVFRRVVLGHDEESEVTSGHRHLPDSHETQHDDSASNDRADESSPLLNNGNGKPSDDTEPTPLRNKLERTAHARVQSLQQQRDQNRSSDDKSDREPLLITHVHRDDGTSAEVIIGQSTLPQTIFNSSNVLIGVGLLSLPLGIRYAGWVIGLCGLFASAAVTKYTAGLLAKCLDVDSSLANFGDIAFVAFGEKGRVTTSSLITLELLVTCVGLVVLFADTLRSLIDGPSLLHWKLVCGLVLAPLNFVPTRLCGYLSCLGLFCSIAIMVVAVVLGCLKPDAPGSLRTVATTYAFPDNWRALPLSFGLIMALWTGHSVFPNLYRDMRHPPKYASALRWIFGFVTSVDLAMAVLGYLLYGTDARDELTTNILMTAEYPYAGKVTVLVLIAIVPLTKFPLQCSPIISTLEVFSGIDERARLLKPNTLNQSPLLTRLCKISFRLLVTVLTVAIAIVIPSFELISALMGGLFGYLICVIIPVVFHLKMFRGQIGRRQLIIDWGFIVVSAVLGIVGTVWEFLPKGWIGVK